MPRRKPDTVQELRLTSGDYERRLLGDVALVGYANAAATAISGIAAGIGGLGIGGGLLLAGLLFQDDLKEALDSIKDALKDTPLDIPSLGDDPLELTLDAGTEPDNQAVDELQGDGHNIGQSNTGDTLTGQSPYAAYTNGASGREAHYQYLLARVDAKKLPDFHARFPRPPTFLLADQWAEQINIRVTCARRRLVYPFGIGHLFNDPKKHAGYVYDPMLDWSAEATYGKLWTGGLWSAEDKRLQRLGKKEIEEFMNWSPPTSAPAP